MSQESQVHAQNDDSAASRWQALNRIERRVAGVLIEKAKTTPDVYPMTINAIVSACNQKSNRFPLMTLDADDVEEALDGLRQVGAAIEVQGDGRVPRYKHLLYDWLGVDKAELAIMAELLLRGQQTLGDLRARAARMEPFPTQEDLRPKVSSLLAKGLMQELTPPGRGQMVSHNLYQPEELPKLYEQVGQVAHSASPPAPSDALSTRQSTSPSTGESRVSQATAHSSRLEIHELAARLESLESQLAQALERIATLESLIN